jgi:hypothetical protein
MNVEAFVILINSSRAVAGHYAHEYRSKTGLPTGMVPSSGETVPSHANGSSRHSFAFSVSHCHDSPRAGTGVATELTTYAPHKYFVFDSCHKSPLRRGCYSVGGLFSLYALFLLAAYAVSTIFLKHFAEILDG